MPPGGHLARRPRRPGTLPGPAGAGQPGGAAGHPRPGRRDAPGAVARRARVPRRGRRADPAVRRHRARPAEPVAATLRSEKEIQDWLDIFEMAPLSGAPGHRAQLGIDMTADRLPAYRRIATPCLVVGFADDLILPPHLGREVADAIPGARYVEVADAGHYGYLERPDQVNNALLDFFAQRA
ncbi:alpha/beta fold hydrolase [Actinomadura keratinilytica]